LIPSSLSVNPRALPARRRLSKTGNSPTQDFSLAVELVQSHRERDVSFAFPAALSAHSFALFPQRAFQSLCFDPNEHDAMPWHKGAEFVLEGPDILL